MTTRKIRINEPCSADWNAMSGSDQQRHCALCDKSVHNLSEMTEAEADEVLQQSNLCVRVQVDKRGRVLHRPSRRRLIQAAGLMAMVAGTPAFANTAAETAGDGVTLGELFARWMGEAPEPIPTMGEPALELMGDVAVELPEEEPVVEPIRERLGKLMLEE